MYGLAHSLYKPPVTTLMRKESDVRQGLSNRTVLRMTAYSRIKEQPELRHVLAHLHLAIDSLANGQKEDALYELASIHGLIFFASDEEQVRVARRLKWQSAKRASAGVARRSKSRPKPRGSRP